MKSKIGVLLLPWNKPLMCKYKAFADLILQCIRNRLRATWDTMGFSGTSQTWTHFGSTRKSSGYCMQAMNWGPKSTFCLLFVKAKLIRQNCTYCVIFSYCLQKLNWKSEDWAGPSIKYHSSIKIWEVHWVKNRSVIRKSFKSRKAFRFGRV